MYIDEWGWFNDFYRSACIAGDTERQQLVTIWNEAWHYIQPEPDRTLALINQAHALATRLREPCFRLFYDYWRCEIFMFYKYDYAMALDLATRAVVEARKPEYAHCPFLARTYRILLDAHIYLDPVGYLDKAREIIAYLEAEVPMGMDTARLLQDRRRTLAFAQGDLDGAYQVALRFLEQSQNYDFYLAHAHSLLCALSYTLGKPEDALKHAQESEIYAQQSRRLRVSMTLYCWQALINQKLGNTNTARHMYNTAAAQSTQIDPPLPSSYYTVLAEYHELCGDSATAADFSAQGLAHIVAQKSPYFECEGRLERCRLLGRLNQPTLKDDIAAAHEAAKKLLKPDLYLSRLARVEQGIYTDAW
ncbi:MAG: hypothetical protein ABI947_26925 [Chloroflexota bacterium]